MNSARCTLDRVFSRYVRLRDCPDGHGRCISCGAPITPSSCDAGHYIPRTHTSVRWNMYNVNAQCLACNRMKDGNAAPYRQGLIKKYGKEKADWLERQRHVTVKVTEAQMRELTKLYNLQINRLYGKE